MLQSIKRALKVDPSDPKVHGCLIRFQKFIEENSIAGPVKQVLDQETQSIFTTKLAKDRNEQFMQKNDAVLEHRVIGKLKTVISATTPVCTIFTILLTL